MLVGQERVEIFVPPLAGWLMQGLVEMRLAPHPQFLHHPPRRRIFRLTCGNDAVAAELREGESEQGTSGFGRVATTLMGGGNDPSDFMGRVDEPGMKNHVSDELLRLPFDYSDSGGGSPGILPGEGACLRLIQLSFWQPPGDGRVRHISVNHRPVGICDPPQHQSRCFDARKFLRHTCHRDSGVRQRQRHEASRTQKQGGRGSLRALPCFDFRLA